MVTFTQIGKLLTNLDKLDYFNTTVTSEEAYY